MPWDNTPAKRAQDARTYGDPEYKRNKAIVRRRSGGRCEVREDGRACGSNDRVQCDHILPVSQGGTHHLGNLRDTCGPHHARKTAQEGGGYRKTGRRGGRREADPVLASRTRW
jgi:HNH endonuclease